MVQREAYKVSWATSVPGQGYLRYQKNRPADFVAHGACITQEHALCQRGRTNQRYSAVAIFLHLKALPAALAILQGLALSQLQQAAQEVLSLVQPGICQTVLHSQSLLPAPKQGQVRAASGNQYASWGQACLWRRLQLGAQLGQLRLELPQVVLCGLQRSRHQNSVNATCLFFVAMLAAPTRSNLIRSPGFCSKSTSRLDRTWPAQRKSHLVLLRSSHLRLNLLDSASSTQSVTSAYSQTCP